MVDRRDLERQINESSRSEEARAKAAEQRDMLLRLLTFGNAGGVVATLSFIGTMIGKSEDNTFDAAALNVLVFFLLGLAGGWLGRMAHWNIANNEVELYEEPEMENRIKPAKAITRWNRIIDIVITWSFSMLGTGILFGLFKLAEMAE